jgi:hypothetical protein
VSQEELPGKSEEESTLTAPEQHRDNCRQPVIRTRTADWLGENPVHDTCSRSATEAARRYDSSTKRVEEPYPKEPALYGVGGWLLLFCVGTTIIGPLVLLVEIAAKLQNASIVGSALPALLVALLAAGGFSIYTGATVWRVQTNALAVVKTYFIVMVGLASVVFLLSVSGAYYNLAGPARTLISVAIWWAYFKKSKRVKATFGANLGEPICPGHSRPSEAQSVSAVDPVPPVEPNATSVTHDQSDSHDTGQQQKQAEAPPPARTMFCIKCGAQNPADAKFCYGCGRSLFKPATEGTGNVPGSPRSSPPASSSLASQQVTDTPPGPPQSAPANAWISTREKAVQGVMVFIILLIVGIILVMILPKGGRHDGNTSPTTSAGSGGVSSQDSGSGDTPDSTSPGLAYLNAMKNDHLCPRQPVMGVRITPIKDLAGINIYKFHLSLDDRDEVPLAFVLTNNSNYCVTHFEWEVELQTDTGESWRETGVTSTASPMHGEMPYNELLRNNNEHQTRISVFAGRVTKAWGFPIPQDRQRGENR